MRDLQCASVNTALVQCLVSAAYNYGPSTNTLNDGEYTKLH